MKRKVIFLTLAIALLLTMFYACSDNFLNVNPKGTASEPLLANEAGVNYMLIGAYAALDGSTGGQLLSARVATPTNWTFGGLASDEATKGYSHSAEPYMNNIENYTCDPRNQALSDRWSMLYFGVSRVNDVLNLMAICNPTLTEATQISIKAQALFLRAWFHFELKKVFNNIPYITEDVDPLTVRNDVDAWPKIEADLQFAVANLPTSQAQVGRPTKYAAEAVLARVYMFQKKWDEAKVLLDDIIASDKYSLMTNFSDNFKHATRNNKESIFELQFSVNDGASGSTNAGPGDLVNYPTDVDGTGTCCGIYTPTQNLVDRFQVDADGLPILFGPVPLFKNDRGILSSEFFVQDTVTPVDPRLDFAIGRRGVPYLDWGIMRGASWCADQSYGSAYVNKKNMFLKKDKGIFSNTTGWDKSPNSNQPRLIRYAHILLWRAECAVESTSPDFAYATSLVNMLRNRANNEKLMGRCRTFILPSQSDLNVDYTVPAANYLVNPYPSTFPNLDYAHRAIWMETRIEFCMEGLRHFDLVRWGIAATTINEYMEEDRKVRWLFGGSVPAVFVEGEDEYWPIPQSQIDLQPDVLIQNEPWR